MARSFKEYDPGHWVQWCPGCGNFGLLHAMRTALAELDLPQHDVVIVSGIGCSGKTPHYLRTYGLETIHGRAIPPAMAIKLANPRLKVIVNCGDGDCYGIGMGHLVHAIRRNIDIVVLVHNNKVYGLTKGQTSPTSREGFKSKSTPHGSVEPPVNPLTLALANKGTFVARGYAANAPHLKELIKKGLQHEGFALIDVLQPCVSFNPLDGYQYYSKRVYTLEDAGHDPHDFHKAWEKAVEEDVTHGEKIPIGLFYQTRRHTYWEALPQEKPHPVIDDDISNVDVDWILDAYE